MRRTLLPSTDSLSWVVGRGGLLGRRVEAVLARNGGTWLPSGPLPWAEPSVASAQIQECCSGFAGRVGDRAWQVVWCAGAGVVGSGPAELQQETDYLAVLLGALEDAMSPDQLSSGQFFLASSAGGVYAGSSGAPYTERSEERPLAPYGFNKLRQECMVRDWSAGTGVPALIGRLSNLYGPGQDLSKGQGLISQVCRTSLVHQPLILYVSLDTLRDYLHVDDAAALIADGLDRLRREQFEGDQSRVVVKILATGRASTIATILGEVRRITKTPVRVVMAGSPSARYQASDLRMNSVEWRELDQRPKTTLSAGIRTVMNDILQGLEEGGSARS